MKLLKIVLITLGIMAGSLYALAEEKHICVEFNGVSYCEATTVIHIGDKEIPIHDPFSLLNSTKDSNVEKIGLWDAYKYPLVIKELAKQLSMSEDNLIIVLKDADPNWKALHELVFKYEDIKSTLNSHSINSLDIDKLFMKIINQIATDIRVQLMEYEGKTNV